MVTVASLLVAFREALAILAPCKEVAGMATVVRITTTIKAAPVVAVGVMVFRALAASDTTHNRVRTLAAIVEAVVVAAVETLTTAIAISTRAISTILSNSITNMVDTEDSHTEWATTVITSTSAVDMEACKTRMVCSHSSSNKVAAAMAAVAASRVTSHTTRAKEAIAVVV
jgi:hypothetical protein